MHELMNTRILVPHASVVKLQIIVAILNGRLNIVTLQAQQSTLTKFVLLSQPAFSSSAEGLNFSASACIIEKLRVAWGRGYTEPT